MLLIQLTKPQCLVNIYIYIYSAYLSVCGYVCMYVCMHVCPSVRLLTCLLVCLSVYVRTHTHTYNMHIFACLPLYMSGARCSSVVRAFAHGAMGRRIDPSWWTYISFQPVHHDWCNKGRGMCYPVCGMIHIKEPLLL